MAAGANPNGPNVRAGTNVTGGLTRIIREGADFSRNTNASAS
jgi:hypothetical protein